MNEMESSNQNPNTIFFGVVVFAVLVLLASAYFFPWSNISWGRVVLAPPRLITVTGLASEQQENQVAQFSAGVSAVNNDKESAVEAVNEAMNTLVEDIKAFGIASGDIQTENLSVFQEETPQRRPGPWRVNNSVTVILRDIDRAAELSDLLTKSGATNIFGPNFMLDPEARPEDALLGDAVNNAREKAEVLAQASGGKLGKIVSVSEGSAPGFVGPVLARLEAGGGGSTPVEPGGSLISKQVSVTFELEENSD